MEEMHIKCPCCGNEMEVSVCGKKSALMLCVCGRCKAPLMMMDGDVFELDREEFQSLRKRLSRVVDVLRESVELRRETLSLTEHLRELQNSIPSENREAHASEDVALRSDKITQEDVDNLQIDLETCKDVSEFIDRM
ncbi:hypothetical protein [uncultured Fibrobacter sp.]|uniref:hypothetical protein n=1 Tax=uncultured Fibrobacter sp. TaxID=261512 RepID=UPI002803A4E1|nr:hypothetical protein [uncultured Fibrobacter sp.]